MERNFFFIAIIYSMDIATGRTVGTNPLPTTTIQNLGPRSLLGGVLFKFKRNLPM